MSKLRWAATAAAIALVSSIVFDSGARFAAAQTATTSQPTSSNGREPLTFQVDGPSQRLEIIVTNSRILTLQKRIPRLLVNNPEIIRATPLSPNQIQVSALQIGVTTLNVWDEDQRLYTVDVVVRPDARQLEDLIRTEFPDAAVRVRPLANSVYLTGYVPRGDMVNSIVRMAEDYYPSVINNLTIGGVQQILLKVKVMEVSRTKLRSAGFDWAYIDGQTAVVQTVSGLLGAAGAGPAAIGTGQDTVRFEIVNGERGFFGFIEALRQYNLVKVLAEPTLVTVGGRPASFSSGGEFPILVPQSLGTVSVEYRQFGTRVDFVPIVLGNGNIRLEVRPQISEIDPARSVTINSVTVPGLRTRYVDTAVEMRAGQTLALAGLIQNRVEAENRGIPWLADLPWFGAPFRRVEEQNNEIELLVMVTPEFVDAMDPHEVPKYGPGQLTTAPNDVELFFRGYLEVPRCCQDGSCANCQLMGSPMEQVQPGSQLLPDGNAPITPPSNPAVEPSTGSAGPMLDPMAGRGQMRVQQPVRYAPASSRRATRQPVRASVNGSGSQSGQRPALIGPVGYDEID